jgi:glycosyltransferase involved in cell wall biosynthesis
VIGSKVQSVNALSGLGPGAVGIAVSLTGAVAPADVERKRGPHLYAQERANLRNQKGGPDEVVKTVSSISVVVPVYNSESILPALINRLEPVLGAVCDEYEVVLVNDGSRDGSWEVIQKLVARHGWVRGINLMRNYGQHNALLCGIRSARGEVIVTMDDDLQNPPEEIPHMLSRLDQGYDVVYGTPQKEQHGLWRDVASKITKMALQSATGAEVAGKASAFRVFRASLSEAFANSRSSYISIDVLLTWGTTRFAAVPVAHNPRQVGVSNYTFRKLVTHALNMTTGYSTAPLRLASLVGFGFTLFGMAILGFVLFRCFVSGCTVQGFPFLASVISIFSGAQLFALGILGEYLARMHVRSMDRPPYTVRQQL